MNSEVFVRAIKEYVRNTAIKGTLETLQNPPGRKQTQTITEMREWISNLDPVEAELINKVIIYAIDKAIFGIFCVLDGVRKIVDEKGEFNLTFNSEDDTITINDFNSEPLHDIYNYETKDDNLFL